MQQVIKKGLMAGIFLWALMNVMAGASDVVIKPYAIDANILTLADDFEIFAGDGSYPYYGAAVLRQTASNEDMIFRVSDGGINRNAIKIAASDYARVDIYDNLCVGNNVTAEGVGAEGVLGTDYVVSLGSMEVYDDLVVQGTVTSNGGYDPPYVLYEQQSRQEIIERVHLEVALEKQGGAALFFNKETKQLETYVASEGKFYDILGNLLQSVSKSETFSVPYETVYYLDKFSGQIKGHQRNIPQKYVIKEGIELDVKTGQLVDEETGEKVQPKDALECYDKNRKAYYDLQGNLLREAPEESAEYMTRYRFDRRTGEVEILRRKIQGRYEIQAGYGFDETTGRFIELASRKVVARDQAVRWISAKERIDEMKTDNEQEEVLSASKIGSY